MADHHNPADHPVARKQHRCIACYYPIAVGERYTVQTGFYDGSAYRNKYHAECFTDLAEDGSGFDFTPGYADPPERLRSAALATGATPNAK